MAISWKSAHSIWDGGVTDLVYSGLWEYNKGRVLEVQRVKELTCVTPKIFLFYRPGGPDDVPSGVRANYLCLLVCILINKQITYNVC